MKTMMAVAALGLAIGTQAHASDHEYNFRESRSRVSFTSTLDGRRYWMSKTLVQQALRDGTELADYAIRNNLLEGTTENWIARRAFQQASLYPAVERCYGEIMCWAAKRELNRHGFYYPAY
jgi:hypothetical protein